MWAPFDIADRNILLSSNHGGRVAGRNRFLWYQVLAYDDGMIVPYESVEGGVIINPWALEDFQGGTDSQFNTIVLKTLSSLASCKTARQCHAT
jgi:hypothetical protein